MPNEIAHKFKRHKRLLFLRRFAFTLAALITVLVIFVYAENKILRITKIEVRGNERISAEDVRNYVNQILNRGFLSLWPKENIIFFSAENLAEDLKKQFSAINQIEISRKIWQRSVEIQIGERDNWAVWCGQKCFYIDSGGIIFQEAPLFLGELLLKIKDERQIALELGSRIMDEQIFINLNAFVRRLEEDRGFSIKNIEIKTGPEFWLYSENGLKIIVDAETDFDRASENLAIFINNIPKEKFGNVDYIDLRFRDKTFYKSFPVF
ncbi:MAG: FtsQ-type POTRA domain-containing protein [Candidatus Niyogibacteria bacterium]|nr:MAG: FtsQ-type POTRA domain-containing protein [Candidatus Niyogibacteria bacterium]